MWLISIQAVPKTDSAHAAEFGGAFVHCWIDFELQDGAEVLAKFYVDQDGWVPVNVEEVLWPEESDVKDDPESLSYYNEAKSQGVCLVFLTWPVDAKDASEDE